MRVLVTGATGFVGKYVVDELSRRQLRVKALVRPTSNISQIRKKVALIYGDLLDLESLKKATNSIDVIVNAAASTPNRELSGRYLANTLGVKNLVEAAKAAKVRKLVHISSISVTFKRKGIYAKTKQESERIIINSGINYIILRPTGIYGKGSTDFEKITKLYRLLPFSIILGSGQHKLQPVYVGDVAKAIHSCLKKRKLRNRIYNIGGPENFTFNESVDKICKAMSLKRIRIYINKKILLFFARFLEITFKRLKVNPERINIMFQDRIVDLQPAKKDLNYNPMSFEEGLKKTLG
jgi:nucleoside-diphosphate-sugar epimerase